MRLLLQLLWLRVLHFYVRRDISGKTQDRVEKLPSRAGLLVAIRECSRLSTDSTAAIRASPQRCSYVFVCSLYDELMTVVGRDVS